MNRIKVITDPVELVLIIHTINSNTKKRLFNELSNEWLTETIIKEKYGEEGISTVSLLNKLKLVEVKWQTNQNNQAEKAYRTYYSAFQINITAPISEMVDIMYITSLSNSKFNEIENKILKIVGNEWKFYTDISKEVGVSPSVIKAVAKRSTKLEVKGHKIGKSESIEGPQFK